MKRRESSVTGYPITKIFVTIFLGKKNVVILHSVKIHDPSYKNTNVQVLTRLGKVSERKYGNTLFYKSKVNPIEGLVGLSDVKN